MGKRVFEHEGRFWEVWRDGTTVMTRFGRAGEGAHVTQVDAGSIAEADHVIDERVRAKAAAGFVEAGAPAATSTAPLGGAELDRQIASLPPLADDPAYLVFADWLQAQGNAWGELVAIQYNAQHATPKKRATLEKAAAELVDRLGASLLGPAARHACSRFVWHHGFVRTAVLGSLPDQAEMLANLAALLAHPASRMLEGVVFQPVPARFDVHRDWGDAANDIVDPWTDLGALAAAIPAHVTHLGFGGWPAPAAAAYVRMPAFAAISSAFPTLRRLELTGESPSERSTEYTTLSLPELVDLEVRFANAESEAVGAINESTLPELERLSVWLGGNAYCVLDEIYEADEGYPDTFDGGDMERLTEQSTVNSYVSPVDIGELVDAHPTVKHLGIQSAVLTAEILESILSRPGLAKLVSLDLSGGTLDGNAAKTLLTPAARKALGKIALDLSRNRLTAATVKKLAAAYPKAKLGDQRKAQAPELFIRYVAVME